MEATFYDNFVESFKRHSSPIDWCEPNYHVTSYIAEFYNTASNAVFVLIPPVLMLLFHPLDRSQENSGRPWEAKRRRIVWVLLMIIGFSSAYFHATLSLAGQLLDEFGILWMFAACIAFWAPKNLMPKCLTSRENRLELTLLSTSIFLTVLGCFLPILNSFILMTFSIPTSVMIFIEIKRSRNERARFIAKKSVYVWLMAVCVWLSDRFVCGLWRMLWLPGGHWLWHILSIVASYEAIIFFIFVDTMSTMSSADGQPIIRFWPSDRCHVIGLPYIEMTSPLPHLTNGQHNGHHEFNGTIYNNNTTEKRKHHST